MNTFIPFTCFNECARALDSVRLNKQVSEGGQIIRQILSWPAGAWAHHPAVLMWLGHADALASYLMACEAERIARGMNPHIEAWFISELYDEPSVALPPWWGRSDIHESHRINLMLKRLGMPHGDYVWPVTISDIRSLKNA